MVGLAAVLTCVATYMHEFPSLDTDPAANVLRTSLLLGKYIGNYIFKKISIIYFILKNVGTYIGGVTFRYINY